MAKTSSVEKNNRRRRMSAQKAEKRKRLKAIAGRRPQIAEITRGVEIAQFPARHLDQIGRKALRSFAVEDGFGGLVTEAPDHKTCVSLNDTRVKQARINADAPGQKDPRWWLPD